MPVVEVALYVSSDKDMSGNNKSVYILNMNLNESAKRVLGLENGIHYIGLCSGSSHDQQKEADDMI